ncbi:MAG: hypothetical protein WKF59_00375 [Chitinophagaceae bacterium]
MLKHIVRYAVANGNPSLNDSILICRFLEEAAMAYIATGSNNTARYFDYYFGRYHKYRTPQSHTTVAILTWQ